MAITFAIEPAALTEPLGASPRDLVSFHKRLIRVWAQNGILVDPGKGASSISQMFAQDALMPVRKIWQDAWKAEGRCRRSRTPTGVDIEWSGIETKDDLATYHHLIEVAMVERVRGIGFLGIPDDNATCNVHCDDVEAVLFPYLDESDKFANLISRSGSHIVLGGSEVQTVWGDIFQPFLKTARRIVVIDRYVSSPRNMKGLFQLLRFLSDECPNAALEIYASNPNTIRDSQIGLTEMFGQIRDELNAMSCALTRVAMVLVLDAAMSRDRYASLDAVAFHLGHGLPELLSETYVSEDTTCTLDPSPNGIIRIIRRQIRAIEDRPNERLEFTPGMDGSWVGTRNA